MKIYDVTLPISKELPVYPGDPPIKIERRSSIGKNGSKVNLSRYSFGSHTGTHIDAPVHFIEGGVTVDNLPIELFLGRARVVEISSPVINEAVLSEYDFTADVRVLFKTRNSYLWSNRKFVEDFVYIAPDGARKLVSEGIKVVGIDYLSVEKFGADEFDTHLILLGAGTVIIEGLDLREVDPGDYEMVCMPLKVKEGDGAPARVILKEQAGLTNRTAS